MPESQQPPDKLSRPNRWVRVVYACAMFALAGLLAWSGLSNLLGPSDDPAVIAGIGAFIASAGTALAMVTLAASRERASELRAREGVREAEASLAETLRPGTARVAWPALDVLIPESRAPGETTGLAAPGETDTGRNAADDRLALAALWTVTHRRLDLYHQIATSQARRSFNTAQMAMAAGFALLIGFAVLAARARTPAAAITTGGLGAVSAAFAGYIGRTFVRSQESAASHLRAYFDQPLEFSRFLAAERLIAASGDLTAEEQAAILGNLVQAIVKQGDATAS